MLPLFTILHPLVDACSVTVLVVGGMSWQRMLMYNALAFALQFPRGVVLDVRPRLVKGAFVGSLALTLAGVGLCACGADDGEDAVVTQIALVLACVGNALFHLSAGKEVLDAHAGKGGPIGLFISTGALGLFAGMKLAVGCGLWCCLGFGVALAVVGGLAVQGVSVERAVIGLAGVVRPLLAGCVAELGGTSRGRDDECRRAGLCPRGRGGHVGGQGGRRVSRRPLRTLDCDGGQRRRLAVALLPLPSGSGGPLACAPLRRAARDGPVLSLMYGKSGKASGTTFGLNGLALFTGSL